MYIRLKNTWHSWPDTQMTAGPWWFWTQWSEWGGSMFVWMWELYVLGLAHVHEAPWGLMRPHSYSDMNTQHKLTTLLSAASKGGNYYLFDRSVGLFTSYRLGEGDVYSFWATILNSSWKMVGKQEKQVHRSLCVEPFIFCNIFILYSRYMLTCC